MSEWTILHSLTLAATKPGYSFSFFILACLNAYLLNHRERFEKENEND